MPRVLPALLVLMSLLGSGAAAAQTLPKGYVSLFADYVPNREDTLEMRARVFAEERFEPTPRLVIDLSGFAETLIARRPAKLPGDGRATVTDAIFRVHDANMSWSSERIDVLAGYARVVWGKLDEIQPTDVINPLDVSRFFFEGRSEARLPVLLARGRWHVRSNVTIEGVYVPVFRRGRFDRLDEPSSPFNLPLAAAGDPVACLAIGCPAGPPEIDDRRPVVSFATAQGGARVSVTSGRVDWSVSAYRGFESFGLYRLVPLLTPGIPSAQLRLEYPRFTMIGADVESVRGKWGMRGEAAVFVEDNFQTTALTVVPGTSIDAGVGVDRRAGDYTLSGTVLFHGESSDTPLSPAARSTARRDVSFVASADRTFARERYRLRTFAVYNATEQSGFVRGIGMLSLRDDLGVEGSIGWFAGDGDSLVGRFGDSDFMYLRLKYYF